MFEKYLQSVYIYTGRHPEHNDGDDLGWWFVIVVQWSGGDGGGDGGSDKMKQRVKIWVMMMIIITGLTDLLASPKPNMKASC